MFDVRFIGTRGRGILLLQLRLSLDLTGWVKISEHAIFACIIHDRLCWDELIVTDTIVWDEFIRSNW